MTGSTGVRIVGLDAAQSALERFRDSVNDLGATMAKVSTRVVAEAQSLTPVRSGRLRASTVATRARNRVIVGQLADYASFVEYGSIHNTAQRMVTKAMSNNEQFAVTTIDSDLAALIARYGLK